MKAICDILHRAIKKSAPIYVISHERSGTHLAINLLYRNLHIDQSFHDFITWRGNPDDKLGRIKYWKSYRDVWSSLFLRGGIIKSHCDAQIYSEFLPKSYVVYVLRDPRDTLVSFYHYLNKDVFHINNPGLDELRSDSFGEFIRRPLHPYLRYGFTIDGIMDTVVDRWAKHVKGWLSHKNVCVVEYEDFLKDFRKQMIRVAIKTYTFPKLRMNSYQLGESGAILPRKGVAGDWKNMFSVEDEIFLKKKLESHGVDIARWK